jgi:hypothetical protein
MPVTDSDRSQIGKIGAYTKWSQTKDRTAATAPARAALEKKFEDAVDPNRELTQAERAKRVEYARKLYYTRLARKSAQARRRRAGGDDHAAA